MKKKFLVMALAMIMVVSLIAVPTSAEGEVTLLESWFETADGTKVYDTSAAVDVTPAFYVNNTKTAAIEDAKLVLASYDASGKLASVNYADAPTIAVGESRVEAEESIEIAAGGETYMMIWDTAYAPVVPKTEITTTSSQAEILSFKLCGVKGRIIEEYKSIKPASNGTYSIEKTLANTIDINLPANSDLSEPLIPDIVIPDNATISPAIGEAVDFSNGDVVYTVTAQNGNVAQYNVKIEKLNYVYSETFSSYFPVLDYTDINNSTTSKTEVLKSDENMSWTGEVNEASGTEYFPIPSSYNPASWTANVAVYNSSKLALHYTRAEINSGTYVLRDGEELDEVYYASTSATEAVTTEADTDIKYVLNSSTKSRVLRSDVALCEDPVSENTDNICLRYDDRSEISITNHPTYTKKLVTPNLGIYSGSLNRISYDFDIYVPSTVEQNGAAIALWHNASTSVGITLPFYTSGNDLYINSTYRFTPSGATSASKKGPGGRIATVKNGLDKWIHLTVDIDFSAGKYTKHTVYVNGEYAGQSSSYNESPVSPFYNKWSRHVWGTTSVEKTSSGTFYIDNMKTSFNQQ